MASGGVATAASGPTEAEPGMAKDCCSRSHLVTMGSSFHSRLEIRVAAPRIYKMSLGSLSHCLDEQYPADYPNRLLKGVLTHPLVVSS